MGSIGATLGQSWTLFRHEGRSCRAIAGTHRPLKFLPPRSILIGRERRFRCPTAFSNQDSDREQQQQQQLNFSVLRFTLGIPGLDESYLPRWLGVACGSLIILNHFLSPASPTLAQLRSEALGVFLAVFSATLPYLGKFLKGENPVDRASLPEGNRQIFVLSENLPEFFKEDLAWGSYVLLRNTNTMSVLIIVEDALCIRGYWNTPEDFSKTQIIDQFEEQIKQIGFLDLKEMVYFPQSPDSQLQNMLPKGTLSLLVQPVLGAFDHISDSNTKNKGIILLASSASYAYSDRDRAWIRAVASKFQGDTLGTAFSLIYLGNYAACSPVPNLDSNPGRRLTYSKLFQVEETLAMEDTAGSAANLLAHAEHLVPIALEKARGATGFAARWSTIISKLERVPACLSDLSTHPCFSKNSLCREQLHSISKTLSDTIELAGYCSLSAQPLPVGKLQMQSDLDAVSGKLEINLRDCALLVKTAVLGDATLPAAIARSGELEPARWNARELLARLQLGHAEAKHRALDGLLDAMRDDEKSVLAVLGRSNISSIVQLLAATNPKIKEKAVTIVSLLVECGSCDHLLVTEGALPLLIRLAESGSLVGREKAVISLQRLSISADTSRLIVRHGGIRPLIAICESGDSISQSAASCALKNLSSVPEVRQALADEGVIRAMINMLDCGMVLGSKEHAAECLQNLTSSNDNLRRSVVSEGGVRSLLAYLDGPSPPECAVTALRNLIGSVSTETLVSLGLLPRLVCVLKDGSMGAQHTAASVVCKLANSVETKRLLGEFGCVPLLVKMLETKSNGAREAAVQTLAALITCHCNSRELKKDEKSVPNLVQLLDPSPLNAAKKYAVSCLLCLSSSKRCRKSMISYGAIGYLKKLSEMDVPGAKKLFERLERGKLRSLFSRK
ncbi:hypothetical protein J5N97_021716 [Dioscorea zingiberensis]|uniref:DUF7032 domain-containing protein n=1 Tax=Dioscorea zingiberensis TaxID=325984 RepID=A0A9D5H9Y4_9LILI|nr:hypothetical protein J5N97_021716 [Dioscorea zingiberensis]